jgi:hypothetical protein
MCNGETVQPQDYEMEQMDEHLLWKVGIGQGAYDAPRVLLDYPDWICHSVLPTCSAAARVFILIIGEFVSIKIV